MKLIYRDYDFSLNLIENSINVVVVENPSLLREMCQDMSCQVEGGEGGFVLSEIAKILKIEQQADFIINPFALTVNTKKMINKLHNELKEIIQDSCYQKFSMLSQDIFKFAEDFLIGVPYAVTYIDEIDINTFLKVLQLQFEENFDSVVERIENYIRLTSQVLGTKVYIFLNLKSFLTENELKELYNMADYCKINIVLLESHDYPKLDNEKLLVIDKDTCIIDI